MVYEVYARLRLIRLFRARKLQNVINHRNSLTQTLMGYSCKDRVEAGSKTWPFPVLTVIGSHTLFDINAFLLIHCSISGLWYIQVGTRHLQVFEGYAVRCAKHRLRPVKP